MSENWQGHRTRKLRRRNCTAFNGWQTRGTSWCRHTGAAKCEGLRTPPQGGQAQFGAGAPAAEGMETARQGAYSESAFEKLSCVQPHECEELVPCTQTAVTIMLPAARCSAFQTMRRRAAAGQHDVLVLSEAVVRNAAQHPGSTQLLQPPLQWQQNSVREPKHIKAPRQDA
jgi:hypothetical protein